MAYFKENYISNTIYTKKFFGAQGGSHASHINPKSSPNLD